MMSENFTVTTFTGVGSVTTGGSVGPSVNGLNINAPTGITAPTGKAATRPHLRLVQ